MDNIRHLHISDHSIASDCMLPGNGGFDFSAFFELFQKNGYKGDAVIEVYNNAYKDFGEIVVACKNIVK